MRKEESEDLLGDAMTKIQNKIADEASTIAASQKLETDRIYQLNNDYQKYIQPIEQKKLQERLPDDFVKLFNNFRVKVERKMGEHFKERTIIRWRGIGSTIPYSTQPFDSLFKGSDVYEEEANKNKEKVLESFKMGILDTSSLVYEKIYYGYDAHQGGWDPSLYSFGYISRSDSELTWSFGNGGGGRYSDRGDLQNLADVMARILVQNQYDALEYDHPTGSTDDGANGSVS